MYVHTNQLNASPAYIFDGDEPQLQFFGLISPGKENIRKGEILTSIFIAYICLQIVELTFYKYSNQLETIEHIPDSDIVKTKISERHAIFVAAITKHFNEVVDGTFIHF
jgi:hypothetical protein